MGGAGCLEMHQRPILCTVATQMRLRLEVGEQWSGLPGSQRTGERFDVLAKTILELFW